MASRSRVPESVLASVVVQEESRGRRMVRIGLGALFLTELLLIGLVLQRRFLVSSASPQSTDVSVSVTPPVSETSSSAVSAHEGTYTVLIAGIDRRTPADSSYRSDINLLATFSSDRKKVLLTSIPRDLWLDGERINAFITTEGIESLKQKVTAVTGLTVDNYVQIDFDALVEGVDALGGIDVEVLNGFTDETYPDDRNGNHNLISVTFEAGKHHMDGERALIFSRSRKGSNGEGSDFKRMARQQQVLKALPAAFFSPKSVFNPFVLERFYSVVTTRMKTDFSLEDTRIAFELLKNHATMKVDHLVLDPTYLYTPSPDEYGGAYVLRPQDENFSAIKTLVAQKISAL